MTKLSDIDINSTVIVKQLLTDGYIRERMLALGLTDGALVHVIRKGPKNNLTVYDIRGAKIALRKEEGDNIIVSRI
ncbi:MULTISPECIES: FeoA family protein [Romboutsia]|uniref:FeoA domain n=1 Tax=Romboutsia hominis TaxID=1507512 RepID=A0A2P2BNG6_9FIRM|nr:MULTISPECIES: FeoA family protein [Romboutsia]MCH1959412.1 ferrous iron transport protein A [Romboutsia hominis]MCH1970311.1 ferrous iron transport protein A [Romboutsia hominis]MDB8791412.1 FeoA family protein [Romboutsia sp. 1001216sp1]MDB8794865.1 FeoA family protein [Romboutsia sp. 1001216sp1]MDB8797421.1 FeoA family protein [Romboutsia sp. 1001216sp1]